MQKFFGFCLIITFHILSTLAFAGEAELSKFFGSIEGKWKGEGKEKVYSVDVTFLRNVERLEPNRWAEAGDFETSLGFSGQSYQEYRIVDGKLVLEGEKSKVTILESSPSVLEYKLESADESKVTFTRRIELLGPNRFKETTTTDIDGKRDGFFVGTAERLP